MIDLTVLSCNSLAGPFTTLLSGGSTETSVTSKVNLAPETCTPTGSTAAVDKIILAAVKNLKTNLSIASSTRLDDYATNLDFVQLNVPTVLADSVLFVCPSLLLSSKPQLTSCLNLQIPYWYPRSEDCQQHC